MGIGRGTSSFLLCVAKAHDNEQTAFGGCTIIIGFLHFQSNDKNSPIAVLPAMVLPAVLKRKKKRTSTQSTSIDSYLFSLFPVF